MKVIHCDSEVNRNKHRLRIGVIRVGLGIIAAIALTEDEGIDIFLALLPREGYRNSKFLGSTILTPKLDIGIFVNTISSNIPYSAVNKEI